MQLTQTSVESSRSATHTNRPEGGLDDDETILLIRTGYVFDALLILVGLIAVAAGHVAGGLGVAGLGMAAFLAGWVIVELSDHLHR